MSEFKNFADIIPNEALPGIGIRVVSFYTADGEEFSNWSVEGDAPLHAVLGLIEFAKQRMFAEYEYVDEDEVEE